MPLPDNSLQAAPSWPTPTPAQAEQAWWWLRGQFEHRCIEVKHDTPGASEARAKQHFNGFLERQLPQEYWPGRPVLLRLTSWAPLMGRNFASQGATWLSAAVQPAPASGLRAGISQTEARGPGFPGHVWSAACN